MVLLRTAARRGHERGPAARYGKAVQAVWFVVSAGSTVLSGMAKEVIRLTGSGQSSAGSALSELNMEAVYKLYIEAAYIQQLQRQQPQESMAFRSSSSGCTCA